MNQFWQQLRHDRKTQILAGIAFVAIVFVSTLTVLAVTSQPAATNAPATDDTKTDRKKTTKKNNTNAEEAVTEIPTTAERRLDGLVVAIADANKIPACVMIENAAFDGVRPQAGLSAAQVVYEVIVEGGITRLMAVFGGEKADRVGPVRSARDTYLEFASEYNCAYTHAGGSYTAMQAIQDFGLRDIDGLREGNYFWRDTSRFAPHNLFTSTDNLFTAITTGHSWTDTPTYSTWKFVDDANLPTGETANEVNLGFGGAYDVKYVYNADGKYYERWNGGEPHKDSNTGNTLTTRNIIVQRVPQGIFIEGKGRVNFSVTGEGEAWLFRNGVLTKGTWKKANRLSRTYFVDDTGTEIVLARGNSWVEILPEGYSIAWQ